MLFEREKRRWIHLNLCDYQILVVADFNRRHLSKYLIIIELKTYFDWPLVNFFHYRERVFFTKSGLPPPPPQRHYRGGQEKRYQRQKIHHVARVYQAAAHRVVVVLNAQRLHDIVRSAKENGQTADEVEHLEKEKAQKGGQQKGHNLALRQRGGKQPDGHKGCGQKEQANVGAKDATAVQVARRGAQLIHREIVQQRRQQGKDDEREGGQKLAAHNLPVRQRARNEQLQRAGLHFLRKGAHRYGRNEKQEHLRRYGKERVQRGKAAV